MILIVTLFAVFLIFGLPIAYTLGFPPIVFMYLRDLPILRIVPQRMFYGMNSFVFLAIPFFILAGEIMSESKITDRLITFADALVGHVRGGLAQVNVIASMFFAGISGAALSDVAGLGSVLIPAMKKSGYEKKFAAAITATSAIQGPIIPPSIIIVVYAAIMGTSVGALFAAGLVPGVLIGLTDCLIVAVKAKKRGYPKSSDRFSLRVAVRAFFAAIPALIMPLIILGGIIGGVFTPTEAGAVAVFYGLGMAFLYFRTMNLKMLWELIGRTVRKSASLFIIIAFANVFSYLLATENVPRAIGALLLNWTDNTILILLVINLFLLFVGTWLETGAAIILLAPVFGPILVSLGFHPVHIGMVMIVNLTIGLITPPVGVCLYAAASVSGCKVSEIAREALPYIILDIGVLMLITYVPEIVMFFPRLFGLV